MKRRKVTTHTGRETNFTGWSSGGEEVPRICKERLWRELEGPFNPREERPRGT